MHKYIGLSLLQADSQAIESTIPFCQFCTRYYELKVHLTWLK